jgi:hypothetical protein
LVMLLCVHACVRVCVRAGAGGFLHSAWRPGCLNTPTPRTTTVRKRNTHRGVVMVGDPQQLPATIFSQAGKQLALERSLFERLDVVGGGHSAVVVRSGGGGGGAGAVAHVCVCVCAAHAAAAQNPLTLRHCAATVPPLCAAAAGRLPGQHAQGAVQDAPRDPRIPVCILLQECAAGRGQRAGQGQGVVRRRRR